MDLLQAWVVVGIPGLVLAFGLFVGQSRLRAWFGYGVLASLFTFFLFIETGVYSALFVGMIAVGYLANGRGINMSAPEHHEERDQFTRA